MNIINYDVVKEGGFANLAPFMKTALLGMTAFASAVSIAAAPTITRHPSSLSPSLGASVTLSVGASGADPVSYQWRFRGANLDAATNATLNIPKTTLENLGTYSVVVTDVTGSTESKNATLSLFATVKPLFVPALTGELTPTNVMLTWHGEGAVQSAPTPSGPWTTVGTTRKNSYSAPRNAVTAFYRLRNPHPREVKVYIPSSYRPDAQLPLLIFLHGYSGDGNGYESYMGLQPYAESQGLLYAHPDGVQDSNGQRFWNAWDVCCDFRKMEINDLSFLRELIRAIGNEYNTDPRRLYLSGHSNGAFMSLRFAMEYPDLIAAVAAISGTMDDVSSLLPPSRAVNILQIHGTADEIVNYRGGTVGGGLPITGTYSSALELLDRWVKWNGCGEAVALSTGPTLDLDRTIAGLDTTVFRSECPNGGAVEHWAINKALHSPTWSTNFTSAMVQWLLDHPKP